MKLRTCPLILRLNLSYTNNVRNVFSTIFVLFFLLISISAHADEMVLIQTVATDRKTFVIRRGFKDGIGVGQESLFSTTKVSLAARAVEVNREYSLWKILEEGFAIPFDKDQIVNYISSVESVEIQIPEIRARREEYFFEPTRYWSFRGGVSRTINQNLSDASTGTDKVRQGMQFDMLLSYNWRPSWEIGLGARYDIEDEVLDQGNFLLPSSRFFIISELTYQLEYFRGKKSNFYISGGVGIGRSQTQVDNKISTGVAYIAPSFRIGWQTKYYNRFWLLLEGLMESVSTEEAFTDSTSQESNYTNIKFMAGIKF